MADEELHETTADDQKDLQSADDTAAVEEITEDVVDKTSVDEDQSDDDDLDIPMDRANIAVRNFPLTAPQLRKKLKLADGGDAYLFGTTMQGGDHVLIRTAKISR